MCIGIRVDAQTYQLLPVRQSNPACRFSRIRRPAVLTRLLIRAQISARQKRNFAAVASVVYLLIYMELLWQLARSRIALETSGPVLRVGPWSVPL